MGLFSIHIGHPLYDVALTIATALQCGESDVVRQCFPMELLDRLQNADPMSQNLQLLTAASSYMLVGCPHLFQAFIPRTGVPQGQVTVAVSLYRS